MKRNLEIAVKILIYATFLTPLVVIPSSFIFPFIVPKILFFRSLVTLMLGAYALLLIINWQEYKPKFTALNLVMAAFLLSFTISTFVGPDPYHSFWDNHERMLGLFTIFHYVAYYFIATAVFKNWTDWKWALVGFLSAGSLVMLIGIFQKIADPNLLLNQGSERVNSSLGNSIYVGGYGLFLCFVSYLLYVKEKNTIGKIAIAVAGVLAALGLFYSGTRGSMLGLLAGIGTAIIGYIIVLKENKKARYILSGLAVFGCLVVALLVGFRSTDFVKNIPAVGRTVNTSFTDLKNSPRWIAWEIAVESWQEKPFFGWGPNNYFYAFNAHYRARSLDFGYGETWFDNAHNIIVNTLAVQGAFGIITYLAIFAVGIAGLFYAWKRSGLEPHIVVVGMAFLVAHLVGNVTVFENPTSYLYFMFWLALINSMSAHCHPERSEGSLKVANSIDVHNKKNLIIPSTSINRQIGTGIVGTVAVACLIVIFLFNIQPARANTSTLNVLRLLQQNPVLAIIEMKKVLAFSSPHIDDIRADIGRSAAQLLYSSRDKIGADASKEIWEIVYSELKKNLTLHPLDIRNQISLSQLAQIGADITKDNNYYLEAEGFLKDALRHSPKRQQIIYSLSGLGSMLGKSAESIAMLEQSITDNSKIAEGYWRLALIYQMNNQPEQALAVINRANENQIIWDEQGNQVVAQIIMAQQQAKAPVIKKK
ncbi:MAG: hypothetical protein A3J93_01240 [Candidatus Magasanikbacteria bacterium RIFOXYC2_FULL_42_28]|uniref:O-antigen ligase-related domain-containing protein n=1 Tax=Candidatus Magasanikbacteria bacterium RIFOXYC2_FULL_42_28 TaxID=1798704 RepID=A0A1F6NYA3_9BACT|nr:MAG: hypothetical protein A3J93_01240 [Candidatus Magasanikbacteria bacterium RIFOXYC2_FULL_42_28]